MSKPYLDHNINDKSNNNNNNNNDNNDNNNKKHGNDGKDENSESDNGGILDFLRHSLHLIPSQRLTMKEILNLSLFKFSNSSSSSLPLSSEVRTNVRMSSFDL